MADKKIPPELWRDGANAAYDHTINKIWVMDDQTLASREKIIAAIEKLKYPAILERTQNG